jgi:DNA-binding transcriptional LysR family regulator
MRLFDTLPTLVKSTGGSNRTKLSVPTAALPDHATPRLSAHAVDPSRRYLSAKVRSFIDFLVEHLASRLI